MNLADRDNQQRQFSPGVESWFLRACAPNDSKAFWVKATTLTHSSTDAVAEAWCSVFDADETFGAKTTIPLSNATLGGVPFNAVIGTSVFDLDVANGRIAGEIENERGRLRWNLKFGRIDGALGEPLCVLPSRTLIDAKFPKNKLLTPAPVLKFQGELEWNGRRIVVENWYGSQGHNWGARHAPEYAWGQVIFLNSKGEPFCYAEGASGRIQVGAKTSPRLSMLTVRRIENGRLREYRFDRLVDLWNQSADIAFPRWSLKVKGADGEAMIEMEALPERMVCLGYFNPNRDLSYCLNSKTSRVTLRVNPRDADGFECVSASSGALEFLQSVPEKRVQPVV